MEHIYIVKLTGGEYEDYHETLLATFETYAEAEEFMKSRQTVKDWTDLYNRYNTWMDELPDEVWEEENLDTEKKFLECFPEVSRDDLDRMLEDTCMFLEDALVIDKMKLGNPASEVRICTCNIINPNVKTALENDAQPLSTDIHYWTEER